MKTLPISVVIPAFNAEATLERALQSVLSQAHSVSEIIVVDDGSTDSTRVVSERHGAAIRYISQENRGVSVARNRGIAEASEEWIAFLDADDEWLPGKLEEQVRRLHEDLEVKWICSNMEIAGNDGGTRLQMPRRFQSLADAGSPIPFFPSLRSGVQFQTSGFIIHSSVFREVGTFDPKLRVCQDRDLWWRIALKHPLVGYVPIAGHRYYVNISGSLTKGCPCRDAELMNVCDRVEAARECDPKNAGNLELHARDVAWNYLIRAKADLVSLTRFSWDLAFRTFNFDWHQRACLRLIDVLPPSTAKVLARRLT